MNICFIDTETTSLDDRTGEVWEVGLIVREIVDNYHTDVEFCWQLPVRHLEKADPISLNIGRFHDRRWSQFRHDAIYMNEGQVRETINGHWSNIEGARQGQGSVLHPNMMKEWAQHFVNITRGAHFVANVPSFDERRLTKLLRHYGQTQMWHYHLVCVENLISGRLGIQPPWKSSELSEAVGVPVPEDRHGALPDARWTRDMYDAVFKSASDDSIRHTLSEDDHTAIFEALGEASMCWEPRPTGVFESDEAKRVGEDLIKKLQLP